MAVSGRLGEKPYWPCGRQIILSIKTEMKADREANREDGGGVVAPIGNLGVGMPQRPKLQTLATFPNASWLPLINSVHAISVLLTKFSI